ncbi:hypothetical protein C8Q75DRAFT_811189 [Abortiporus biennis]|nr:hypothetical protein C8Q75DRAFT_811189 [Abortiporus biennis]
MLISIIHLTLSGSTFAFRPMGNEPSMLVRRNPPHHPSYPGSPPPPPVGQHAWPPAPQSPQPHTHRAHPIPFPPPDSLLFSANPAPPPNPSYHPPPTYQHGGSFHSTPSYSPVIPVIPVIPHTQNTGRGHASYESPPSPVIPPYPEHPWPADITHGSVMQYVVHGDNGEPPVIPPRPKDLRTSRKSTGRGSQPRPSSSRQPSIMSPVDPGSLSRAIVGDPLAEHARYDKTKADKEKKGRIDERQREQVSEREKKKMVKKWVGTAGTSSTAH